jgi:2-methylcitrate dehydratase PrpD
MIDTAACMVAGAGDEAAETVRRTVSAWDDNYHPAKAHASAAIIPALLALAEERGLGGADVLDAYMVGLEVMGRVGQAVNLTHYTRGWHGTSTVGTIGSAAASARLLGLDARGMGNAISLATSMAGGSKKQFGTPTKPVHAGLANQFAVMAATLAEQGMQAIEEPLDGSWGFKDLFAGDSAPGFDAALQQLGNPLAIEQFGLAVKVYPCCGSVHRSLDGVLLLREAHALTAEQVETIETIVPRVNYQNLMYERPVDEMQMRFSMQYCLAVGMAYGEVAVADFAPGMEQREPVARLIPRVSMLSHDNDPETPDATLQNPAIVRIATTDGRLLETRVQFPKGTLQMPLTEADFEQKFRSCAGEADDALTNELIHLLQSFAELDRLDELMSKLAQACSTASHRADAA